MGEIPKDEALPKEGDAGTSSTMSLYRMRMQHTRQSGTCWIYEFFLHDDDLAVEATIAEAKTFVGIDWFEGIYIWNMTDGIRPLAYVRLTPQGAPYLDELPDDERIPFPEISPEPLATLYLLLPPTLKERIVATAKKAGVALNEWVVRCLERGTGQSE